MFPAGIFRQIVRAAENLTETPVEEDQWKNFSCEPRKSYALKCTDDDDEMSDEKIEGKQVARKTLKHSNTWSTQTLTLNDSLTGLNMPFSEICYLYL